MRRTSLLIALIALSVAPGLAHAQEYRGNWGCRANVDGAKAGLLSIIAGNYAYASANFGSTASGTGTAELYADGVMFTSGNLLANAGIEAARLTTDANGGPLLSLTSPDREILTCTPR
ncbi:hypothetical protein EMQ25_03105 [Arsenicitalea aurantiaca]|uniref:Uncharacterized protein n=1 Tax=Arsenicitalea aurantiaca TaxID=1783274 RepID=A0A433XLU8_9HYPH|nr:hypothetical protein [Arsenicitalea aurantiaca]RUT34958.1 hypothetical protein EMQ25_03105 [Arsenicitalea aurantiaca]